MKDAFVEGVEAAIALDKLEEAEEILSIVAAIPPGRQSPYLDAHTLLLPRRKPSGRREPVESGYKSAVGMFRELETPFWLAVALLEFAEWLVNEGRKDDAKPLLDEARECSSVASKTLAGKGRSSRDRLCHIG